MKVGLIGHNSAGQRKARFMPSRFDGLQLWLDASDETTITDTTGNVTAWADKSGNGNNVTSPTFQPRTGDSTENGLNIIDFTSDQMIVPSALYSLPNGDNTVFVVSKRATEDGSIDATFGAATGITNEYFHIYSNVARTQSFTNRSGGGGAVSFIGPVGVNTNLNIAHMRKEGTDQTIAVNGGTEATPITASNTATIDDFFIGTAGSGAFPLIGSIAEMLFYDRNLSPSEISAINQYLANKWGVTLV